MIYGQEAGGNLTLIINDRRPNFGRRLFSLGEEVRQKITNNKSAGWPKAKLLACGVRAWLELAKYRQLIAGAARSFDDLQVASTSLGLLLKFHGMQVSQQPAGRRLTGAPARWQDSGTLTRTASWLAGKLASWQDGEMERQTAGRRVRRSNRDSLRRTVLEGRQSGGAEMSG